MAGSGGGGIYSSLSQALALHLPYRKCGDGLDRRPDQACYHKVQNHFALTKDSPFSHAGH